MNACWASGESRDDGGGCLTKQGHKVAVLILSPRNIYHPLVSVSLTYVEAQVCTHAGMRCTYSRRPSNSSQRVCPWLSSLSPLCDYGLLFSVSSIVILFSHWHMWMQSVASTTVLPPLRKYTVGGKNTYFLVPFSMSRHLSFPLHQLTNTFE